MVRLVSTCSAPDGSLRSARSMGILRQDDMTTLLTVRQRYEGAVLAVLSEAKRPQRAAEVLHALEAAGVLCARSGVYQMLGSLARRGRVIVSRGAGGFPVYSLPASRGSR